MIQKHNHIRCKAIRDAANGEDCTICESQDNTIVFCHLNESFAGKGLQIKSDDIAGFFGCRKCHSEYDTPGSALSMDHWEIMRAMYRTWRKLWDRGIIGEINQKRRNI